MSAKPMTAAAAIMASNANRQSAPSPTPTPATKTQGNQASQLTELEPELPVESLKVDSLVYSAFPLKTVLSIFFLFFCILDEIGLMFFLPDEFRLS
jgi:hypothetical protein